MVCGPCGNTQSVAFGPPSEAVTGEKQRRIFRSAEAYLLRKRVAPGPCRFDVVTILESGAGTDVAILRDAFPDASELSVEDLELVVDLELAEGASLLATEAATRRFEEKLKSRKDLVNYVAYRSAYRRLALAP